MNAMYFKYIDGTYETNFCAKHFNFKKVNISNKVFT